MNLDHFKVKLEKEQKGLENQLSRIAHPNPEDPGDWQTTPEHAETTLTDPSELADVFEESANKEALEMQLEAKLNQVKDALKRIEDGRYGKCEVEGCQIEEKRLEADPTATTCIRHTKSI